MIDSSASNRNPVPPIIHVIDDALGRLLYFSVGYRRGVLHSSEIDAGESAMGQKRPKCDGRAMSASPPLDGVIGRRACG